MKQWFYILTILTISVLSCSNDSNTHLNAKNLNNPITNNFLVSAYIRGNFYHDGRISSSSLNACNDLICTGITPNIDGSLNYETFELKNDQGVLTYQELIADIQSKITANTTLRLGISGGKHWKEMIANQNSINNFVQNINNAIEEFNLSGVDLDFEWAQTSEEYHQYSEFIFTLSQSLGKDNIFSVSLDPTSYKISSKAIESLTYVSLQCYGPSPYRFSYDNYVETLQKLINYGIPVHKIVAGLPFYGVTTNDSKQTVAYYTLVNHELITSPNINEVNFNGNNYVFNGQNLMKQKVNYAIVHRFYGVMCWSLGIDVDYTNQWSLLKTINSCLDK